MTPGRIALVVLATAGLLFFAVMLFGDTAIRESAGGRCDHGRLRDRLCGQRRLGCPCGQRFVWFALATGLAAGQPVMACGATSLCMAPRQSRFLCS